MLEFMLAVALGLVGLATYSAWHQHRHARRLMQQLQQKTTQADTDREDYQHQIARLSTLNTELQNRIEDIERQSIQSKALYTTISNISYDMVFVLDEDLTIIAMNSAAEALFGARNSLGERLPDVIDSEDLASIVGRAVSEADSLEEQITISESYYRVRTQVMQYDTPHLFIGVALQDITRLVRLNRARRDMVANISHELSTPIANIRLIIDGLFHEQDKPKRKASIQSLRDIAHETESLQHLVQELLDLSMIESGQAIMRLVPVPLVDVVDEMIERLADQLATKNLSIVKHIPEQLQVLCDRDQTRRVLVNLIRNSIKWSPEDDTITVSALIEGEDVIVSVFDNGPGVPDDQRERIFERFYQVDTARTKGDGSGLGLAISKHIVEAHGGRIWAEGNSQGGGGRFSFSLLNADTGKSTADQLHDATTGVPGSSHEISS